MDTQGNLVPAFESTDYDASWETYNAPNHPPTFDQQWPGNMPASDRNTVTINVKFDSYPQEVTWQFQQFSSGEWRTIRNFDGQRDGVHNELVSAEMDTLSAGWFRFAIQDSQNDGICCDYRRGWISIIAPIVTTRAIGLVWGNNGEFGGSFDIYLRMNDAGFVDRVSYSDPVSDSSTTSRRRREGFDDRRQRRRAELSSYTELPRSQLKERPVR
jgi:hypothetical protein